jgi:hypothetical protein
MGNTYLLLFIFLVVSTRRTMACNVIEYKSQTKAQTQVPNLPFISKIIEKIVAQQITDHLNANQLFDSRQFAYRANHSCELALLTLSNHIYSSADNGEVTVVLLLDMSAAFDTVQHDILLDRLLSLGVCGHALNWLTQYLRDRASSVSCRGVTSAPLINAFRVPQGSVLGPLIFIIYIYTVSLIIKQHDVNHIFFADDLKLYASAKVKDISSLKEGR